MTVQKKFVFSAADVVGHDVTTGAILFVGKTLIDSSLETSLSSQDVRGGRGNPLLTTYYHSAEMNIKITDAQWNLDMLAKNVGSSVITGENIWYEEEVTLNASKEGTVTKTPIAAFGSTIYAWVTHSGDGSVEQLTFSSSTFTSATGTENEVVTVRYYTLDAAARSLTIRSDMVPSVVRLVMKAMLTSPDSSSNQIGEVEIEVFKGVMPGSFSISMTADGVASTPLNVRALKSDVVDTSTGKVVSTYAKVKEILTSSNWYTDVIGLSIVGGDFTLANGTTKTLDVRAIPSNGAAFKPPYADLTFASSDATKATVGAQTGLVTWVAAGPTTIKCSITSKNTIDANIVVTCGA